jgi:hypothetical protein
MQSGLGKQRGVPGGDVGGGCLMPAFENGDKRETRESQRDGTDLLLRQHVS